MKKISIPIKMQVSLVTRVLLFSLASSLAACVVVVPPTEDPSEMDREVVQVGETSKEELQEMLGEPSERAILDKETMSLESWSYVYADVPSNPIRFFPLLGAAGFAFQDFLEDHSFALNFSRNRQVLGVTSGYLRTYGYSSIGSSRSQMVLPYGSKNLNAITVYSNPNTSMKRERAIP